MKFKTQQELDEFKYKLRMAEDMMRLTNKDGSSYFHIEFVMKEILGLSTEEIEKNKEYNKQNPNGSGIEFEF